MMLAMGLAGPELGLRDAIVDMWCEVLDIRDVPCDRSFFELGGTSFHAMRIVTRVRERFGVECSVRLLLENPTVEMMSTALAEAMSSTSSSASQPVGRSAGKTCFVSLKEHGLSPPLFLLPPTTGQPWSYSSIAAEPCVDRPVLAGRAVDLDWHGDLLDLRSQIAQYLLDIRRIQPAGPYLVGGYSGGGPLAYEIACHLEADRERVHLILLDTFEPPSRLERAYRSARGRLRSSMAALSRSGAAGRWIVSRFGWDPYHMVLLNIRALEPITPREVHGILRAAFPAAAARKDLAGKSLEELCEVVLAEIRPLFPEELWKEISRILPARAIEWLHLLKLVHKNAAYDRMYRPQRRFGGRMTIYAATTNTRIAGWQQFCSQPVDVRRFPAVAVGRHDIHLSFLASVNVKLWIDDLMALLRTLSKEA